MTISEGDAVEPVIEAGKTVDYLEVAGEEPIAGVHADWSEKLLRSRGLGKDGPLCEMSPVYFDVKNSGGTANWGPEARGRLVVTLRGDTEFEVMARRAEASGAVGLVIVDNLDVFEDDWEMASEDPRRPPPGVPAVLVPKHCEKLLCKGSELQARLLRRSDRIVSQADALKLQFLRMRGVQVRLKFPK
eukprot:TRINITY_DN85151_c0_g1_i1.p1 TRINITY_DN85151_c0_g1~~TRINITY_DN85151_c0_g1_i1.p1  ORF type:complete len:188 (-),score=51.90 TRINITY_DN85151_c0_g1_i1:45-608(-)